MRNQSGSVGTSSVDIIQSSAGRHWPVIIMTLNLSDWFISQLSSAMSDSNHLNYPNMFYRVTLQPRHLVALLLLHKVGDLLQDVVTLLLGHRVTLGLLHQLELQVTGDPRDLPALLPGHLLVVQLRHLVTLLSDH